MRRLWVWLWLLTLAVAAEPQVEVALFEGGEGLGYFQRCAAAMGGVNAYGDPRISEKLRIRLLEGKPPEVSNANLPYEQLIRQGKILALDPWLDAPGLQGGGRWRDQFLPGSLDRYRIDGKTYGIPLPYVVQAVYYSKRRFRDKGWSPPQDWEQWLQLCQQVQASGQAPLAFQGRYTYYASPLIQHLYFHLAGRQAYREQLALKPGSFDNPAMVEALDKVQTLAREHFQTGNQGMSHTEAQLEFLQGRAAMLVCGSWLKSEMRDKIPSDFELGEFPIPLPHGSVAEPHALQTGAGYFFVFAESAQPEKGVDYLRTITRPDLARQLAKDQDLPVAIVGANQALSKDLSGLSRMLEQGQSSFGESMTAGDPGMVQVWSDIRYALLHSRNTPAELAHQLEEAAGRIRRQQAQPDRVEWLFPGRTLAWFAVLVLLLCWGKAPRLPLTGSATRRLIGKDLWLLAGPPLLVYWLFFLGPAVAALLASGSRWDGLGPPSWVGSLNFQQLLLASPRFWQALGNNLFLMACVPTLVTAWSLLCAVLLEPERRRHRILRIVYFFPHLLGISGILIWQQLYHPQGPLNSLLCKLGLEAFRNFAWLSQENLYLSLLPLAVWGASGFQMVLTSAALAQVPSDLREAAHLEGADRWQQFWYVSWPFVRPTVVAGYFLLLISAIKSFESVWLLTNQEPTSEVHVLGTLLMQTAFAELRLGQATALAAILLVLVIALQRVLRRWEEDDPCAG